MKAAIIGCGAISQRHADALKKCGIEIAALCDVILGKTGNLKERYLLRCSEYTDFKEMLGMQKIDAVHICTPHYLHAEMAGYALKKNINVLLEKPACINEKEIEMLRAAQKESGAQLGVCFQNRYLEGIQTAKKFLKDKKVQGITGTVLWSRDKEYYTLSEWRGSKQKEGGGVLINQAIHTLDLMQWLSGTPEYITATVSNRHLIGVIDVEDTAECYWETENGSALLYATTAGSRNYPINIKIDVGEHLIEIAGENCEIDGINYCRIQSGKTEGKDYWGIGHYNLINEFYNCINDGKKFPIDIEEGTKALKMLFAIYKSEGQKVKV
ncbi:MAG: Gfo/Idh/MocA family oxidoreductase [Clostridia bacterium]|nr:Gfo/Idh/MocA family oxidoreductase [Clostridia bacterium]